MLWTCIPFMGGIGGRQEAPCGAVSASAVAIGLLNRAPLEEKEKSKQGRHSARKEALELVMDFTEEFGNITCRELVGMDFSSPGEYRRFLESGIWKDKCMKYVQFVVEKIYELEGKRGVSKKEKVTIYTSPGCKYCAEAKKDLKERGVPYDEISIEGNPEAKDEVMRLSDGSGIVPVIVTGKDVKVGFGGG